MGLDSKELDAAMQNEEKLTTVAIDSRKVDSLIAVCMGRIVMWRYDGVMIWLSTPIDEECVITHLAVLEPTDDPRAFCYLAAIVQHKNNTSLPVLQLHSMIFKEKSCVDGINFYTKLEGKPKLKFAMELDNYSRVLSLQTIERESGERISKKPGEESLLLIGTESEIILVDLNQWYLIFILLKGSIVVTAVFCSIYL